MANEVNAGWWSSIKICHSSNGRRTWRVKLLVHGKSGSTNASWGHTGTAFVGGQIVPSRLVVEAGIGEAGKGLVFVRRRDPAIDRESGNGFIALTSRCSHVGCPVNYVPAAQSFVCPCHGGVYDFRGRRTAGPPPRPLDRFQTRVRAGQLEIGPRYSLDSRLRRHAPHDPGESLDGLSQYLYP